MASPETWAKLRYFKKDSPRDQWGSPDLIADELLLRLDDFRHTLGVPVYVTAGVNIGGHKPNSFHYPQNGACAVDVVVPDFNGHPVELLWEAMRFGFTGVGFYPHWKFDGRTVGGLHLDLRPLEKDADGTVNYRHSRWLGVMRDGQQIYLPLTYRNLLNNLGGNHANPVLA